MTPRRERHGSIDRDSTSRESDVTERSRQNEVVTRHAPSTVTALSHARYTRHTFVLRLLPGRCTALANGVNNQLARRREQARGGERASASPTSST